MAVRIRKDGKTIICAAKSKPKKGDVYLEDGIHYMLAVEMRVLKPCGITSDGADLWKFSNPKTRECQCEDLTPGGIITVNDVKNPHCFECGKSILNPKAKKRIKGKTPINREWESRFDKKFSFTGSTTLLKNGNLQRELKTFIQNLLSTQKAIQHSKSYSKGLKEGKKLAKKLPEMLINQRVKTKLDKQKADLIEKVEGMKYEEVDSDRGFITFKNKDGDRLSTLRGRYFNQALSKVIQLLKGEV